MHHLNTARECYFTCISLLKQELSSRFEVILAQVRKFNQEPLLVAYRKKVRRTIHILLSSYENLAFVTILGQNFYAVQRWAAEGLSFLANVEKGLLGFQEPKSRRLKIDLKKSFIENFKQNQGKAGEGDEAGEDPVREIELFKEEDWSQADKNLFLRRKFNLLTYQQISETKIGDLRSSDRTQNLLLGLLETPEADARIGDLKSFYAIGELQTQQISASKVALYNQTLLSMIKNRYSSNLLKKYKRINNMGGR